MSMWIGSIACRDSRPALVSRSDVCERIEIDVLQRGRSRRTECETLEGEKVSKRIAVLTIARFYFFFRSKLANGNVYGTPASRSLAASFSGELSLEGLSSGMPRMGTRSPLTKMASPVSPFALVNATL